MGKTVTRRINPDDVLRQKLSARGTPAVVADIVLGFYTAARNDEFSTIDPTLERLLGRPAARMRTLIAAKIGA